MRQADYQLVPGLSQTRLASLLGVSERTVRGWLTDRANTTSRAMPEPAKRLTALINANPGLIVPMLDQINTKGKVT